jgi:predicted DNA-binding protein (MmcQ/YjbR family)
LQLIPNSYLLVAKMMDHKTVEEYVLSMPNARLDYPFGEGVAVYKVGKMQKAKGKNWVTPDASDEDRGKMFALIHEGSDPLRISLKCDPQLSKILREKYETVMEGYHLNKKHWNTIILTGQLPWEDIQGLIRHSYDLVSGGDGETPHIE